MAGVFLIAWDENCLIGFLIALPAVSGFF